MSNKNGDINNDGISGTGADLIQLMTQMNSLPYNEVNSIVKSGELNQKDINYLAKHIVGERGYNLSNDGTFIRNIDSTNIGIGYGAIIQNSDVNINTVNSIAIGNNTQAIYDNSIAIGTNVVTTEANQIVIGDANSNIVLNGTNNLNNIISSELNVHGDISGNTANLTGLNVDGDISGNIANLTGLNVTGNVGINTNAPTCIMDISSNDAIKIPVGNTSERPTPSLGQIRYNSQLSTYEGFGAGDAWGSLGGVKDVNGDTYILAETSAGANNDELQFFTADNQRMIIDANGNVGIGISNPESKLHVKDGPICIERTFGDNSSFTSDLQPGIVFLEDHASNDCMYIAYDAGGDAETGDEGLGFYSKAGGGATPTGGTQIMMMRGNGRVGIGTTSPESALDVSGDLIVSGNIIGYSNTEGVELGIHEIKIHNYESAHYSIFNDGDFKINNTSGIKETGFTGNNLLTIKSNGNVGIGTANPDASSILHVEGNALQVHTANILDAQDTSPTHTEGLIKLGLNNYGPQIHCIRNPGWTDNTDLQFWTSGENELAYHAMTIKGYVNHGNVGIGTTSPECKLDVSGNIKIADESSLYLGGGTIDNEIISNGLRISHYDDDGHTYMDYSSGNFYLRGYNGTSYSNTLALLNNGNVGIGTTSPYAGLQVHNDSGVTISPATSTGERTAVLRLGQPYESNNDAYCAKITSTNNHTANYNSDLRFYTYYGNGTTASASERMRITSDGKVGIGTGTTIPVYGLEMHEKSIGLRNSTYDTLGLFSLDYGNYLHIGCWNKQGSTSKNVVLNLHGGNVGIGTTPSQKLEVDGNISCNGNISCSENINCEATFIGHVGHLNSAGFSHSSYNSTQGYALLQSSNGTTYLNCASNKTIYFRCNNIDKMTLTSGGKLTTAGSIDCGDKVKAANGMFAKWYVVEHGSVGTGSDGDWLIDNTYDDQNLAFYSWHGDGYFGMKNWFEDDSPDTSTENGRRQSAKTFSFTGQHRCITSNIKKNSLDDFKNSIESFEGLIVNSTGEFFGLSGSPTVNIVDSVPIIEFSRKKNDKKVFGVISSIEENPDKNTHINKFGGMCTQVEKKYSNEYRVYVNSLGEGGIWVSNINGSLENGDYITSSNIPGYGCLQDDDLLHNYTVAKITCDCDFSLTQITQVDIRYHKIDISENKIVKKYYDSSSNEISYQDKNETSTSTILREDVNIENKLIDYDNNGNIQYENILDSSNNEIYNYKYKTRFIKEDGTLLENEEDYITRKHNNENVYIACFVGCSYHCG